MNCIKRTELEQFLKGKLAADRLLAVDEHVSECADCKNALRQLNAPAQADFGATVMGAIDCPEYEELSAYIDESLAADRAVSVRAHANICELCARDIDRIQELRSHAALRSKVTVQPGMSRSARRSPLAYWKQALAAVSVAGVVTLAAIFGNFGGVTVAKQPIHVASQKPAEHQTPAAMQRVAQSKDSAPIVSQPNSKPKASPTTVAANPKPATTVSPVLRDGAYSVIHKGSTLALANKDGSSVRTALEARVAASIDEKLRTGKIKPLKPVQVAMVSIHMRGNGGYEASPTAPKQIGPMEKVVLSTSPVFTWSAVNLAESYRVRVYNSAHNLVVDQIVSKNAFTPAKPLQRGQVYSWRVGVRFGETDQWAESAAVAFAVVSADDYASIKRVQSRLPGSHLALGATYESVGLYDEAANEYRALRRANPNSKLAQKLLYGAAQR